jgi:GT2 family glycosyltransferase
MSIARDRISDFPKVLISVLNWQDYESTSNCVHSVLNSSYKNFEIVIIDNNSPNESFFKLKAAFPELKIIKSFENNGYAAGHSLAVEIAIHNNADLLWILNNDLLVEENALSVLVDGYCESPIGIFGSVTLKSKNPDVVDFAGGESSKSNLDIFSYNIYHGYKWEDLPEVPVREVQSVEGSSMLIPMDIIKKYGFIKTDFFMYGEETDYCLFLRKKGIQSFVVRNSRVLHKGAGSFSHFNSLAVIPAYYRRRNFLRIMKEHYHWSVWKCLNHPESIIEKMKFLIKCWMKKDFKNKNQIDYYRLSGSIDGAFGRKNKRLNPENYIL